MKIDFGATFGDLFTTREKWMTILLLSVCTLIPVVGPIVVYGYVFRRFARTRIGKEAEDFSFEHFAEYLRLGAWPFLGLLVARLALTPLVMFAFLPMVALPFLESENEILVVGLILLIFALYLTAFVVMLVLPQPLMLRTALKVDFAAGFSWTFITDFLKKVGWSLTGWYLMLLLIGFLLSIIGMLALYVGLYFVATWMCFATVHLLFQHYDLFLERGGEPIEFAEELVRDFPKPGPSPRKRVPPALPEC